jgi:hypothetical protein
MTYTYELISQVNPRWDYVLRSDGAVIPIDMKNVDYLDYLTWITEQNNSVQV